MIFFWVMFIFFTLNTRLSRFVKHTDIKVETRSIPRYFEKYLVVGDQYVDKQVNSVIF